MAKKNFSAGTTKSGVLNNDGGEKLREIQAKTQYNFKYIPKEISSFLTLRMSSILRME